MFKTPREVRQKYAEDHYLFMFSIAKDDDVIHIYHSKELIAAMEVERDKSKEGEVAVNSIEHSIEFLAKGFTSFFHLIAEALEKREKEGSHE